MRWGICHVCNGEEDTIREDKTIIKIHECWSCWKEYCDKHGSVITRICDGCLEDAHKMNEIFNAYG